MCVEHGYILLPPNESKHKHICTCKYSCTCMYNVIHNVYVVWVHMYLYYIYTVVHTQLYACCIVLSREREESSQYTIHVGVELTTAHTIQWCVHMNCGCMKSHNSPWGSKNTKQLVFPAETCTLQLCVF